METIETTSHLSRGKWQCHKCKKWHDGYFIRCNNCYAENITLPKTNGIKS